MIIDKLEAIAIRIPLTKDFGGSTYSVTSRCTVITRLWVKDGPVAEVYNGDNRSHGSLISEMINDQLAPLVIGKDHRDWQLLHSKLIEKLPGAALSPEILSQSIACVDSAIWDAMGLCYDTSVSRLLGGTSNKRNLISIGGYYEDGKTLDDLGREMQDLKDRGMSGCKVKVGGLTPEQDAERVRIARDANGPDFLIAVDANRGWSWRNAVKFAHLIEDYDIAWFEEPCHWMDDVEYMKEVRLRTSIPINAGQSEITGQAMRRLINSGAVDIINFDASEGGGVTTWKKVAAIAELSSILMTHHEEPQIASHLLSSQPHGMCVECFANPDRDPLWASMLIESPTISGGFIHVAECKGFGLKIDPAAIDKYRL
ncbi:MAG: mandelate racemase/muconate lactonizing protein [Rhodospirillaceae bacterium]|mgnify:CR=1 FL=1|nr:mandelate racemase/muconate lactonizing protein [Rhodospirillaceae bacterium]|tara:strand:- start:172 stop:1281 length:1110 start_codon:yes stop_codon:yes gene_type:complete